MNKLFTLILVTLFFNSALIAQNVAKINVTFTEVGSNLVIEGRAVSLTGSEFNAENYNNRILFNSSALTFVSYEDLSLLETGNDSPTPGTATAPFNQGGGFAYDRFILFGYAASPGGATQPIPATGEGVLIWRLTFTRSAARGAGDADSFVQTTAEAAPFPVFMQPEGFVAGDDRGLDIGGLLPVELVSFEAEKHENTNALLTWATSQEINSDYFQVEGSENGYDWAVVGKVAAAGFSNSEIEYSYVDQNVATLGQREGTVKYYRLRIVDLDRTYDFSDVKSVSFDGRESKSEMAMFPNPSKYGVTIEFDNNKSKEGTIQIFDVTGKNMYNVTTSAESYTQHYIDLQKFNISAGTYMVIVNIDGEIAYSDKLIVQE
jgi:hypothetical protein